MFAFHDRNRIIDAHHHFWIYDPEEYCWIDDSMNILKRNYLPQDLRPELHEAGVTGTVVVQARQNLEETRWLLKLADQNIWIKGVVGWVDLRSESITACLDEFVIHTKFRGVRHVIHDEPDIDFMLGYEFKRGIQALSQYDLTYDLLLFPEHLKNAARLVKKFPGQKFILDHISKPSIKSGDIDRWKKDIFNLAGLPNIYCKISGMVTEADLSGWKYDDFVPYMDAVVEAFGTDTFCFLECFKGKRDNR